MWTAETSRGHESLKCRDRCLPFLQGATIFDLGSGMEKVVPKAVGIDLYSPIADLKLDLSQPESMYIFNENVADAVFSSHSLEHFHNTEGILKSWWRVIKPNGYLILYLPDKDLYPSNGNPDHKHEFKAEDILRILDGFASYKLIKSEVHSEDNEYSFEIVAQKIDTPAPVIIKEKEPEVSSAGKKCLVIRYGATGDMIYMTPILKLLKQDGYVVHLVCTPRLAALENNPNIDKLFIQERDVIPSTQLGEYHKIISKGYDKVINLCESIERTLLFDTSVPDKFYAPHEQRDKMANVNYYDRTLEIGGYGHIKGLTGELYLSDTEKAMIKILQKRHEGFFKIMFQVRGSSEHKIYPYISDIVDELVAEHEDIRVFIVGGKETMAIDWIHPNIRNTIGIWNERQSLIMTSAVDLVVSPETGVLNAAGCFDTPKIGLLTHSSKENLTKYFRNDYSIQSEAECSPCHRLVHKISDCKCGIEFGMPICMERGIPQEKVKAQIVKLYEEWKATHCNKNDVSEFRGVEVTLSIKK